MKKLLIIQQDDAYFLSETLQVLERHVQSLKDYDLTLLIEEKSFNIVHDQTTPFIKGITTNIEYVKNLQFDVSVNLSLNEATWNLHSEINSLKKIGFYNQDGLLVVEDSWSSYLLTLKSRAPFLTFHLQDVYKNILGIKTQFPQHYTKFSPKLIAYGTSATKMFPALEQENFLNELSACYPGIPIKDITEIDLVDDVSECLYIGPATLNALQLTESGGKGIFLSSGFQGFNLLPNSGNHYLLSSRGNIFRASHLLRFIENDLRGKNFRDCPYSVYSIDHTSMASAYLKSHNQSDDTYPFYQTHVVLWNFLLNLSDVDLDIIQCSPSQIELLEYQVNVLTKFIRLHDYAMTSVDKIHAQAKSQSSDRSLIDEQIKNLQEVEKISDQIAASHALLRPILDFYRIRRGQNNGVSLLEQASNSLVTYAEEHQALKALEELFSVTLRKNEVSI